MTYDEAFNILNAFKVAAREPHFALGFIMSSYAKLIENPTKERSEFLIEVLKKATKDLQPCQKETMPTKEAAEAI